MQQRSHQAANSIFVAGQNTLYAWTTSFAYYLALPFSISVESCLAVTTIGPASVGYTERKSVSGVLTGHENRVSCLGVSVDGMALCTGTGTARSEFVLFFFEIPSLSYSLHL